MTKMTKNGISTTSMNGQEQYETFTRSTTPISSRAGRQIKKYVQYDYRHTDGELFSYVRPTLDACRAARDAWLAGKVGATV